MDLSRTDALRVLVDRRPALEAEHAGDIGTVDVGIHQPDAEVPFGEGDSEVGGQGGLAHASLAAGYGYHIFNARNLLAVEV